VERSGSGCASGSGKVAVGGRCAAVGVAEAMGMVCPDVAMASGSGCAHWLWKAAVERSGSSYATIQKGLWGAAARPCQVTLIWDGFS
jgi:hypothetical protein